MIKLSVSNPSFDIMFVHSLEDCFLYWPDLDVVRDSAHRAVTAQTISSRNNCLVVEQESRFQQLGHVVPLYSMLKLVGHDWWSC